MFYKQIINNIRSLIKGMKYSLSTLHSPLSTTLLISLSIFLLSSCGTGDDDGARLGEFIAGSWYRVDLQIEGDTGLEPEDLTYDRFDFTGDGSYNGMVREGEFAAISKFGNLIYDGTYKCDNNNLRLEFLDEGKKQKILAQVISFTENTLHLRYVAEDYDVTINLWLRKE